MSHFSLPQRLVGGDLMSLVVDGTHTAPLVTYREYVQNAIDSIASSGTTKDGKVEISIEPGSRRVTIRDNGPGLTHAQSIRKLVPVANSSKNRGVDRGFRGIGRLSGLAFGDTVSFRTRQEAREPVSCISWDSIRLRKGITGGLSIEKTISDCISIETVSGDNYPAQFFQVEIEGIARFAAGSMLNREVVRAYIADVCPVPFAPAFQYAERIANLFQKGQAPLTLNIFLNGEETPITRKHGSNIFFSKDSQDSFMEFEEVAIPMLEREGNAAIGWFAHSSYLGALPGKLGIRGIRARIGNVQIGGETLFDHLFKEERFNRWCVGEIHILDPRIVPNGRRDYFEPTPHTRNLENHLGTLFRNIEKRCRVASGKRNKVRRFQSFIDDVEKTYKLAASGYLAANSATMLIEKKLSDIAKLKKNLENVEGEIDSVEILKEWEEKLAGFQACRDESSFSGIVPSELPVYQKIFHILADHSTSPDTAIEMIETILKQVQHTGRSISENREADKR